MSSLTFRVADAILNSFSLLILILLGAFFVTCGMYTMALACFAACVDCVDDVFYDVAGRHIYPPDIGQLLNPIFEMVAIAVCFMVALYVYVYAVLFFTPFWAAVFLALVAVIVTNCVDLVRYGRGKEVTGRRVRYL